MKAVRVEVSQTAIAEMVKTRGPFTLSIDGVPEDAVLINSYYDDDRRVLCVIFKHDSFQDVPDGMTFPIMRVSYTKHWARTAILTEKDWENAKNV